MHADPSPHTFILSLFDHDQWCSVVEARFEVADLSQLRELLEAEDGEDPNLDWIYRLDDTEAIGIIEAYGIGLNFDDVAHYPDREFMVRRPHQIDSAPYLVHTTFELPLLLDGRKKLATRGEAYPPMTFEGEERFDHWVTMGVLHKEVVTEPFAEGVKHPRGYLGTRSVYYTPKGEEWRIPAMKLLWRAHHRGSGWNETFERLEGMLFGYEDWQNDWWIERYKERVAENKSQQPEG